jgi:hypothetical protein
VHWVKVDSRAVPAKAKKAQAAPEPKKKPGELTPAAARKELKEKQDALEERRSQWIIDHVRERISELLEAREMDDRDEFPNKARGKKKKPSKAADPAEEALRPPASEQAWTPSVDHLVAMIAAYGCGGLCLEASYSYFGGESRHGLQSRQAAARRGTADLIGDLWLEVLLKARRAVQGGTPKSRPYQVLEAIWIAEQMLLISEKDLRAAAAAAIQAPKSWAALEALASGAKPKAKTGKTIEAKAIDKLATRIAGGRTVARAKKILAEDVAKLLKPKPKKLARMRELGEGEPLPVCRVCGCTDEDCTQCFEKTGEGCTWVEPDLCSACAPEPSKKRTRAR